MVPLADTHVHLLAGRDDGPASCDVAQAMCRMLVSEGVGHATALAHQNVWYPDNTPSALLSSARSLSADLAEKGIPLCVYPTAEVMLSPTTFEEWQAGRLLSIGNHGRWLLVEMPHGECLDILPFAESFRRVGVRLVIAHAERCWELLDDPGKTARWIEAGCLIQVTAQAIAAPASAEMERALKEWARLGFIHVLGSDGHGINRRQPLMAEGFQQLVKWVGRPLAEQIGSRCGQALLQGLPIEIPTRNRPSRKWFTRLFGT